MLLTKSKQRISGIKEEDREVTEQELAGKVERLFVELQENIPLQIDGEDLHEYVIEVLRIIENTVSTLFGRQITDYMVSFSSLEGGILSLSFKLQVAGGMEGVVFFCPTIPLSTVLVVALLDRYVSASAALNDGEMQVRTGLVVHRLDAFPKIVRPKR